VSYHWRVECECGSDTADNLRMHHREGDQPDTGTRIVCNNCGDEKVVGK